jgi:hypothetical protein
MGDNANALETAQGFGQKKLFISALRVAAQG